MSIAPIFRSVTHSLASRKEECRDHKDKPFGQCKLVIRGEIDVIQFTVYDMISASLRSLDVTVNVLEAGRQYRRCRGRHGHSTNLRQEPAYETNTHHRTAGFIQRWPQNPGD